MHLKSLTLKGFKSFASATTFHFEPGITAVVGPNGSGKSNVVDALAWVMGEQGAKSLRGGKMEDVIFAGSRPGGAAGRAPLGRAEVSLTIDNTDGALPIDYAEVTISRTCSATAARSTPSTASRCRLLDVQELLSDSGIGREMHVIVGQGQLDAVLSAGPEERRGFIEEAAGVLKHRKRKEKALRKLDAMQANLTRVQDLTVELRRQLKPLGRQAEVARRAAVIQSDLRDSRLRHPGRRPGAADRDAGGRGGRRDRAARPAGRGRGRLAERRSSGRPRSSRPPRAEAPALTRAQETWYRLSSLRERFRGTGGLAAERVRHLAGEPEDERTGPGPRRSSRPTPSRSAAEEREIEATVVRDREAAGGRGRGPAGGRAVAGGRAAAGGRRGAGCRRPARGTGPAGRAGVPRGAARSRPARPRSAG